MSNPTLFLYQGNGSLAFSDRAGGGTLTGSGAVRYAPASGARQNRTYNPSFETNTTGWGLSTGATITRVTTDAVSGSACLQVAATSSSGSGVSESGATAALIEPGTWCKSFYVKLSSGEASNWEAVVFETAAAGTVIGGGWTPVAFTPTSSWQRVSLTQATAQTGEHRLQLRVRRTSGASASSTILIDAVQTESGSTATDYFDGSTGGVWLDPITGILGTAHASPSVSQAVGWVEEGTTNAITNPSLETNTSNWNPRLSSTCTRDTTYALFGSASFKTVTPGSVTGEGFYLTETMIAAANGQTWTGSIYLRGSGNVHLRIAEYSSVPAELAASTLDITLTDTWTRYSVTRTLSNASTAYVNIAVRTINTAQAITFYADGAQLEQKAYATSYCDGSLGTGYAWSGTAHASSSTRTAATLYLPWSASLVNTVRGHVALRESPRDNLAINGRGLFIVSRWNLDLDDHISMSYNAATFTGRFETNGSGASMVESLIVANEWKLIWMAWDANSLYMGNGSSQTDTTARAVAAAGTVNAGQPTVYFGADPAGSHHNGYIGPVLIADRPLTAKERATLNANGVWTFRTLAKRDMLLLRR